jgi:hypothetical protein
VRKLACELGENLEVPRRRSRFPAVFLTLLFLFGLGPLVLEGSAICLSNWKEVMGVSASVQTPALDHLQDQLHLMSESFWLTVNPYLQQVPWEPKAVLPTAALVTAAAMLMIRR